MKTIFSLSFFLLITVQAGAQFITPYNQGQKTLALNVNPVFDYLGNFFNATENNGLNISSAGLLFRNITAPNRALRLSFYVDIDQDKWTTWSNDPFVAQMNDTYLSFFIGKEYFKTKGISPNMQRWRFYGGWDVGFGTNNFKREYTYANNPFNFQPSRELSTNNGLSVSTILRGFLGCEYLLTNDIFVGIEASLGAYVAYRFPAERVIEYYEYNNFGEVISATKETTSLDQGIEYGVYNGSPVLFRVGLRL